MRTAIVRNSLLVALVLISASSSWANWCTVTHIKFNDEYTKMEEEGEPFKIATLDATGHNMALIMGNETYRYRFLRNVKFNGLIFREFRNDSMVFQLGMPKDNGSMIYQRFFKDSSGTERGFAGLCSGA